MNDSKNIIYNFFIDNPKLTLIILSELVELKFQDIRCYKDIFLYFKLEPPNFDDLNPKIELENSKSNFFKASNYHSVGRNISDFAKKCNSIKDGWTYYIPLKYTIEFFENHPSLKKSASKFFELNLETIWRKEDLITHPEFFKWDYIAKNKEIEFSESEIEVLMKKLNPSLITLLINDKTTCEFLQKNSDILDWKVLSQMDLNWKLEIIETFKDKWNWSYFPFFSKVKWDYSLIQKFDRYLDFSVLSSSKNVEWTDKLVKDYEERWDWERLSGNQSFLSQTDFYNFLYRRKDKIKWKPSGNYYDYKCLEESSISTNSGIKWNLSKVYWVMKLIDFWAIAKCGKINDDIIINFSKQFDRKEHTGFYVEKYAGDSVEVEVYTSGWDNLEWNSNFKITDQNIYFLFKYIHDYSPSNPKSILDSVRNSKCENISLDQIIDHYSTWGKILLNEKFINQSILEDVIKPQIEKIGYEKLLIDIRNNLITSNPGIFQENEFEEI